MLKKGFSLAEVLITLTIVGIVSVIVAPYVSNLMPNKDKIEFLRAYNLINQATQDLLSNESIYYTTYEAGYINPVGTETSSEEQKPSRTCEGLNCTAPAYNSAVGNIDNDDGDNSRKMTIPEVGTTRYFDGRYKYPNLMIKTLSIDENPPYITARNEQSANPQFFHITKNIQCRINSIVSPVDNHDYSYSITIKLLNGSGNRCAYNSSSCTNPDMFQLQVDKWGNITGADNLSKVYLKNPNNTSNKNLDLRNAQRLQ